MADESVDAIWFARGGYGSNRIAEAAAAGLPAAAQKKTYSKHERAEAAMAMATSICAR